MTISVNFAFEIKDKKSDRTAHMHLIIQMEPNTIPMPGHSLFVERVFAPPIKDVICVITNGQYIGPLLTMETLTVDNFDDTIKSYKDAGFSCEISDEWLLPVLESDSAVPS